MILNNVIKGKCCNCNAEIEKKEIDRWHALPCSKCQADMPTFVFAEGIYYLSGNVPILSRTASYTNEVLDMEKNLGYKLTMWDSENDEDVPLTAILEKHETRQTRKLKLKKYGK